MAVEIMMYMEIGKQKVADISKPALIIHGTDDHIVPVTSSQFISSHISSEDKTLEV